IRLHPLVCTAFNADFDGDQMAVHLPLSTEAQVEARVLMLSVNNILSPANGRPITVPSQDMVLGCYYLTKKRPGARGEGMVFSSRDEVRIAYDHKVVAKHASIKVKIDGKMVPTTVGCVIMSEILPEGLPFDLVNREMSKKEIAKLIDASYRQAGARATVLLMDNLKDIGFKYACEAGISICMNDMHIPYRKGEMIAAAEKQVMEIQKQYSDGLITNGERYNKVIDIWASVTETIATEMMSELGIDDEVEGLSASEKRAFNSIYMMADSGARGSAAQLRQLAGMRGLMAKPSGEIIEAPIQANFREGLKVLEYFISTHGARKGLADTALKTANSGYLTRRLVDVAQDVIITEVDCGTLDGIVVSPLVEGGEIIEPLDERILGRVTAGDILDPVTGDTLLPANTEITEDLMKKVVDAGIDRVKIRSVLTCNTRRGTCRMCYGRDLARGHVVDLGEAVGIIAAQSIGEPGTQLTMRTFHIGGTASKVVEQTKLSAKNDGIVEYINLHTVKKADGSIVVMNRNGKIAIRDASGREKERYMITYGANLHVSDKMKVKEGQTLVDWDPYSMPILTEVGGKIALGDIVEGSTMREEVDETTGLSHKVIIDYPANMRPRISIKDESGKTAKIPGTNAVARYLLPAGAHILVEKGDIANPGDILVKIPRETTKTKDITGGLPRVAELFAARRPKEQAVISEIDGAVEYGGFVKGMRRVIVKGALGDEKEYLIPKGKHVNVHEGDWVVAGEPLMDGSVDPHDILDIMGPKELQKYLVDQVQQVYRLQGVSINDKHIEVIVRQMLRKVRVEDAGDTRFLIGEQVDRFAFVEENDRVVKAVKIEDPGDTDYLLGELVDPKFIEDVNDKLEARGARPAHFRKAIAAVGKPILLGITKASLSTDSFISAASFQETTRVLTEAAINGNVDHLLGLKENVIMGRLIPAGTGISMYRETYALPKDMELPEAEAETVEAG
ncbi:MAG: DNA-directed RNA polymerase subunit beta', partial [Nitrospirae bacterium]|nr:DNA-directed RNA polymerase subunit beta' [Nitrospirota bacterium]